MSKIHAALLSRVPLIAAALILGDAARAEGQKEAMMDKPLTTFDEHALTLRVPDDSVNFHLGGRLQVDLGSGGSSGLASEFEAAWIRRIWIEPKLTIDKDLIFNLQYDPSSQRTPIN